MPDSHTVFVDETLTGNYMQNLRSGRHGLSADEPLALDGNDAGPNPYELVMMALGACTNMTLRMYASHKNWPLEQVHTQLTIRKVHAKDCQACTQEQQQAGGSLDEIRREITLRGELSAEQRQRLLEIANKCPIHRLLSGQVIVRSELMDE